jgi:hypothetical protein
MSNPSRRHHLPSFSPPTLIVAGGERRSSVRPLWWWRQGLLLRWKLACARSGGGATIAAAHRWPWRGSDAQTWWSLWRGGEAMVVWSRLQRGRWWPAASGEVWRRATGSSGIPGAISPVPASSASLCCSFKGAGSGRRLSSSALWPSSGCATMWAAVARWGVAVLGAYLARTKFRGGFGL